MSQAQLRQLREEKANGESGFTLIELLVVVVIIGILVAIAIPLYLNYRKGAENKAAASDLRNAVSVMEQCYSDNANSYPSAVTAAGVMTGCAGGQINLSSGDTVTTYTTTPGTCGGAVTCTGFIMTVSSANKSYTYNSANGGSVQ